MPMLVHCLPAPQPTPSQPARSPGASARKDCFALHPLMAAWRRLVILRHARPLPAATREINRYSGLPVRGALQSDERPLRLEQFVSPVTVGSDQRAALRPDEVGETCDKASQLRPQFFIDQLAVFVERAWRARDQQLCA